MRRTKRGLMLILTVALMLGLASCGGTHRGDAVYAVEAGSAGEAAALEQGWEIRAVSSQAAALMEVQSGTSDRAVVDQLMAGAMIGDGTSYPDLVLGESLTEEFYAVGCRKNSDLKDLIQWVLAERYADGTVTALAKRYGLESMLVELEETAAFEPSGDTTDTSDVRYIQQKGTLLVGTTAFAPLDYRNEQGEWIGFDAELARLVAEELGVQIEFVEIEWDSKLMELESKAVDVLWNGMTLTEEVRSGANCTAPYCRNAQVIVEPGV